MKFSFKLVEFSESYARKNVFSTRCVKTKYRCKTFVRQLSTVVATLLPQLSIVVQKLAELLSGYFFGTSCTYIIGQL